ncbi:STAS domain-containing protein [Pseudonocardia sp. CA-107938]|uniref:STAS domain-containing protein n=1 Tax=Pseudonocardia sp. CA-107938 TaxID=3240021 RepID=UPI003D8DB652
MPDLSLITTVADVTATIAVRGDVDMASADELRAAIAAVTDQPHVVVDLTATGFFDSSGIRVLFEFADRITEVVVVRDGIVARVLDIASLDDVIPLRVVEQA